MDWTESTRGIYSNGQFATLGEFPYYVSIREKGEHECGGSLISKQFVLTVATCTEQYPNLTMAIVAVVGTIKISGGNSYLASRDNITKLKDSIALLRLNQEVVESQYVRKIKLTSHKVNVGQGLIVTGMRVLPDISPSNLRKFMARVVTTDTCKEYFPHVDVSKAFCALAARKIRTGFISLGDLAITKKRDLAGILLYVTRYKDISRDIMLFVRVPDYLPFIRSKI